jgi:creatinine amidohydrolase
MYDARNTSKEIGQGKPEIAVFGVGAIEQHSIHLPLGTDWLGVADITRRVAAELNAFLVPAITVSMSECHGPMAGTVWLKPHTLAAVVRDVVLSLYSQGFRKVLMINGHGGNFVLEAEMRNLNLTHPDLILLMPTGFGDPGGPKYSDAAVSVHAGDGETSHQLYINGAHVKDKRIDYAPPVGREFLDYAYMGFLSEFGVWGYPSTATAEKGERGNRVTHTVEWARAMFAKVEALRAGKEGRNAL